MKAMIYKLVACMAIIIIVSTVCNAQPSRSGRMEIGASLLFLDGETIKVDNRKIEEDDWFMYGVTLGKNINDNFNINSEVVYGKVDVDVVGLPAGTSIDAEQETVLWLFNLDYNILSGPLTPYVSGGLGYGYSNAEVEYTTPDETTVKFDDDVAGLAYTVAFGGRWDIGDNFLQAAYRIVWDDEGDRRSGIGVEGGFLF